MSAAYTLSQAAGLAGATVHQLRTYIACGRVKPCAAPTQRASRGFRDVADRRGSRQARRRRSSGCMTGNQSDTMTTPTAPQTARQRISAYLFTALALLTCPCHLPIWIALLASTTAGAYLSEHWGLAALALTGLFVLSVTRALRVFGAGHERCPTGSLDGDSTIAGGSAGTNCASLSTNGRAARRRDRSDTQTPSMTAAADIQRRPNSQEKPT